MSHILLLASKSASRKKLLEDAKIPFQCIDQDADETKCDWNLSLDKVVESIALYKMEHALIPEALMTGSCFVLTADTLSQDIQDGTIHGKPVDRADAIEKIKKARQGSYLCTAFCLDKKIKKGATWHTQERIVQVVSAEHYFDIPDQWIEKYLDNSLGLSASNAIAIEGYGEQFLKSVHGSYSTIVGLPMFELRQALEKLNFFI